jgi:hypothetical protein
MYKIAICGKANTGKNTLSQMFKEYMGSHHKVMTMAFADPIKHIIKTMFPQVPRKHLFGSSKHRNQIIPGAIKDGNPLTIRQALIDIGTGLGRSYQESLWINNFHLRLNKIIKKNYQMVIVTDVRFVNEFKYLQSEGFYLIKLTRDNETKINHISETNQDLIPGEEFNNIIINNGSLEELSQKVKEIMETIVNK